MFYIDEIQNKKILKSTLFREFEGEFTHLFTTRESFIKTKDDKLKSTANSNRKAILDHLNIYESNLIEIKQTHGTKIALGSKTPDFIDDTDGIILYKPSSATILNFADCTPVVLYDPEHKVLAGLHAGWRGTAGCISRLGVKLLKEKFGSNPCNIRAVVGPCIGKEDFETGLEVYEALKDTVHLESSETQLFKLNKDKAFCDLAGINKRQLMEEGVKTVDVCAFKTYKDNNLLFSYRRENGTTSRISLVLKLL